jgi:hypothetical protein
MVGEIISEWWARSRRNPQLVEVFGKERHLQQICCLGVGRQVPHLHIFSHPLAKHGHGKLHYDGGNAASSSTIVSPSGFLQNPETSVHRWFLNLNPAASSLPRSGLVQG